MTLLRRHRASVAERRRVLLLPPPFGDLSAQDQAPEPSRIHSRRPRLPLPPDRLEVTQDDLVKVTIRSEDFTYSFAIDEYRIVRRVPAGETTIVRVSRGPRRHVPVLQQPDGRRRHAEMQGQLVVRPQ